MDGTYAIRCDSITNLTNTSVGYIFTWLLIKQVSFIEVLRINKIYSTGKKLTKILSRFLTNLE